LTLVLLLAQPVAVLAQTTAVSGNRILSGWVNFCTAAGSVNAYTCALSGITQYRTGTRYTFVANAANTGAATWNLNSLGAKTLKKVTGSITTDLVANDIRTGQVVDTMYDGVNLQMLSQPGTAASGSGTGILASGTLALATASIPSGQCATAQTATAAGTASTDVVSWSFASDPTGVTGYTAVTSGTLRIDAWTSATQVAFRQCNATQNAITPGALSLNWRTIAGSGSSVVGSGSQALLTTAVNTGACDTSPQTVAVAGLLTTDTIVTSFNADVSSVLGYTPSTTGSIRVETYPTSGTLNIKRCNSSPANITPGSVTLNYRIVR